MSKKSNWGRILLTGASLAAMGAITPAFAQDEDVSEEIVVTATGRAAAIQDVPIAVTAVSGEALQNSGAQDLRDVTQVAPSLEMGTGQSNSSGTTARIRGIGTGSDNPGFEAAVGIFIDGVYRARAGAALADLPELERVEVLRGPQGTLYGRNTSAGAISVITAGPDFSPGMWLEGTFGFDDLEESGARAGVNVPLTDSLAVRLDGSIRARDGYITDLISGDDINTRDRSTLRAQAVWDISPDATLRVIVDGAQSDEVCCGITPLLYGSTNTAVGLITGGAGSPPIDLDARAMTVTPGRSYGEETEEWGISGQLDWDLGFANFTSITAYRDWDAVRDQDVDFNVIDIAYRDGLEVGFENFTQEFRLQGETGRVNWLVGAFYADETLDTTDTIRIGANSNLFANLVTRGASTTLATPNGCELYDSTGADTDGVTDPIPSFFLCATGNPAFANVYLTGNTTGQGQQSDHWIVDTQSIALFTHNEISLSDALTLTVGLRYSSETKDLTGDLLSTSNSCLSLQGVEAFTDGLVPGPGGIVTVLQGSAASALMNIACNPAVNPIANGDWEGDSEEEELSGTISLAYNLNDDVMVYGGYSRGYKAGGFNVDRSGFAITPALIDPSLLSVDQLAFAPEFTDAYEIGIKSTILGGTTTVNLTGFYQEIHDYQLNAFNGFNFITRNIPEAISQGAELEVSARPTDNLTLTGGVVYTDAFYDSEVRFNPLTAALGDADPNAVFSGQPFAFAPELTVTAAATYVQPIGDNLQALFYIDTRWNDGYRTQTLSREPNGATDNGEFAIFNGRVGIGSQDERWSVELWGRNLFDESYFVGAFSPPLQNDYVVYPNEPATYGLTIRARY
ncbi:TonB-dependent receptor [Vitreimonas flagellata]|uniref:TonB-dependent receptor n=1 Tax=Vitreimonas flagellata TaxID=2560861 RepID=UPI00143060E0|nr:TonB-dependent receptor [Vitreimonas flagellata]